jgi:predicted ATPase
MVALYRSDQQAEALGAYQQARQVLGEQLGIEPNAALRRLEEQILLEELPLDLPRGKAVPTHNLPARTSVFIGRRDESAQVESLVGEHRLVTLTGVGGVGKTSLAVEVARDLVGAYPDGVWLVELASLSAPDQVVAEIGRIFDVAALPPRPYVDLVLDALASRQLLLIVDNCEHLVHAAAAVGDALLRACPGLRILATSREPLHIAGEQIWSVSPLAVPPDDLEISVTAACEAESVALFVERAGEASASFELDASDVDEVAALCRRLDGIPLALELAAARIAVLSPRQILDRLDDRFALLTRGPQTGPRRQQTLRATMEWSHDLLSIEERTLLRRFSVFHDGFTLEAAEAICSDELLERVAVLDLVGRLVDTSLLTVQAGVPVRYGMLDTVRHYARERLGDTVEATSLQRGHAEYYAALATPGEAGRFSEERGEQYRKLASEEVNLRAALEWALDNGEADLLLRMTADLCVYWFANNRLDETLFWVPRALEVSSSEPTQQRAEVLYALGIAYAQRSMLEEAQAAAEELARIAEVLGDAERASDAIFVHWISAESAGDLEGARRLAEEQVRLLRRVDHPQTSFALFGAALLSVRLGDVIGASRFVDEAEVRAARLSQARVLAMVIGVRGSIAHSRGDLAGAERLLSQAVGEFRRLGWIPPQMDFLGQLAAVAIAGGRLEQAETWARDLRELAEVLPAYDAKVESVTLLARVALLRDQLEVAHALLNDALEIATDTGNRLGVALLLAATAQVAWAAGDAERATMLHAGAAHLQDATGYVLPAPRAREIEREQADIRSSIGQAVYETAWAMGEAMNQNELVESTNRTQAPESPLARR